VKYYNNQYANGIRPCNCQSRQLHGYLFYEVDETYFITLKKGSVKENLNTEVLATNRSVSLFRPLKGVATKYHLGDRGSNKSTKHNIKEYLLSSFYLKYV